MAPEQVRADKQLTWAVDVYGLGAILYELLAGQPPFPGTNLFDILKRVQEQEPAPPSRTRRHVPRDLETICLKCLNKDPQRRYGSALEVAKELRRFLNREPIRGRPVSAWERAVKWTRRKPAVAALMATIVLLLTLGLGIVFWQWQANVMELEQLEAHLDYNSRIRQVPGYLEAGYRFRAEDTLLNCCPEKLRHWEWHFLRRWCQRDVVVLRAPQRRPDPRVQPGRDDAGLSGRRRQRAAVELGDGGGTRRRGSATLRRRERGVQRRRPAAGLGDPTSDREGLGRAGSSGVAHPHRGRHRCGAEPGRPAARLDRAAQDGPHLGRADRQVAACPGK